MKGRREKKITEAQISKMICERGIPKNDHVFVVPVKKNVIIEFDGRICVDAYEDLPAPAPCIVNCLWADEIRDHVWFTKLTNFSTHFPDMHNDSYNLHCLPQKCYQEIVDYLNTIPKRPGKKSNYKTQWLKIASAYMDNQWVFNKDGLKSNFIHSVDCHLCCDFHIFDDGLDDYIQKNYVENLTPMTMLAIKMLYPNADVFNDSMYLSNQTLERKLMQVKFINAVMKKVWSTVSDSYVKSIYKMNPEDVLKHPINNMVLKDGVELPKFTQHKPRTTIPAFTPQTEGYTDEDCKTEACFYQLYEGAPYIIKMEPEHKNDKRPTKIIPAILRDINIIPKIEISDVSIIELEDIHGYTEPKFDDYFENFGGNYFGTTKIMLTFENAITHDEFTLRYGISSSYYDNGIWKYVYLVNGFKYPEVPNPQVEYQCGKVIGKLVTKFTDYINSIYAKNKKVEYVTVKINGINWCTSNVVNRESYFDFHSGNHKCRRHDTFDVVTMHHLIPPGYRLPTADEVLELFKKYPPVMTHNKETDQCIYDFGGKITITDSTIPSWHYHPPMIYTSDTLHNTPIDSVRIFVDLGGRKQIKRRCHQNILLLIKE